MTGSDAIPARPRLHGVGASETGRVRSLNEDRLVIREDLQLFLVADGAGGHTAGDVAASVAVLSVVNFLEATTTERERCPAIDAFGIPTAARWLARAVHKANRDVHEIATTHPVARSMGSTLVAALFSPTTGQLHVAHVGDSRCYRIRGGYCDTLTRDHSLVQDVLEERPELEEAVLVKLPRNVVTRALGMAPATRVAIGSFDVAPGDRYLLCSDGLWGYVPAQRLAALLAEPRPAGATVQLLLNAVDEAGAPDNVTALLLEAPATETATDPWRPDLLALESAAAERRALIASEPELFILGIEELDLGALDERPSATTEDPPAGGDSCPSPRAGMRRR